MSLICGIQDVEHWVLSLFSDYWLSSTSREEVFWMQVCSVVKHTGNRAACHCRMLAIDSDNIADDVIDFI